MLRNDAAQRVSRPTAVVREGPSGVGATGTRSVWPARTTLAQPSINYYQLDRRVRPVPSDYRLVGKGRRPAAVGLRGSNPAPGYSVASGQGGEGHVTCDSRSPKLTARARREPGVPNLMRTQRGPGVSGPVRSRTPPALRSSATRDRSAGRARQGRCKPRPLIIDYLLAEPDRPGSLPATAGNRAGRRRRGTVRGCPLGPGQDRCEWHASGPSLRCFDTSKAAR